MYSVFVETVLLFFDFGGSPVGTYVEISNIILVKE